MELLAYVFNFVRVCHSIFHRSCTVFLTHSGQEFWLFPTFTSTGYFFFIVAILMA